MADFVRSQLSALAAAIGRHRDPAMVGTRPAIRDVNGFVWRGVPRGLCQSALMTPGSRWSAPGQCGAGEAGGVFGVGIGSVRQARLHANARKIRGRVGVGAVIGTADQTGPCGVVDKGAAADEEDPPWSTSWPKAPSSSGPSRPHLKRTAARLCSRPPQTQLALLRHALPACPGLGRS